MIRSAQYIYPPKVIWTYTEEEWKDPILRRETLQKARSEAQTMKGIIIIKLQQGRRKYVIATFYGQYKRSTR